MAKESIRAPVNVVGSNTQFPEVTGTLVGTKFSLDTNSSTPLGAPPGTNYFALSQTSLTDVYTFKSGGSGGTTLRTTTITYTDSTKATISSVAVA